jgi:hypothetical protein
MRDSGRAGKGETGGLLSLTPSRLAPVPHPSPFHDGSKEPSSPEGSGGWYAS